MEVQFEKKGVPYLKPLLRQVQNTEQTQELRLSEGMGDVGRILGAWGQVILRGKEWRSDTISCNGGFMVWVLYAPEDGSDLQTLESWIPFQMHWNLDDGLREGDIRLQSMLRSVDARSISARKIMVRCSGAVMAEAGRQETADLGVPGEVPPDVQLLKNRYPLRLPREMGEKSFLFDEDLTLPGTLPVPEKLVSYTMEPRITDIRVNGDKLVFRGSGMLHVVYLSDEGTVTGQNLELPISQFAQLERQYGSDAQGDIRMALTNLEMDLDPEGKLHVKCGALAQYVVDDREMLEVVEDAYSTRRELDSIREELSLPGILEQKQITVPVQQTLRQSSRGIADVAYLPDFPVMHRGEETNLELPGQFQVLYYDDAGTLQNVSARTQELWQDICGEGGRMEAAVFPGMPPQATAGSGMELRGESVLQTRCVSAVPIPMITGFRLGEEKESDRNRPSVILRRAGENTLWEIAKGTGSTVAAIREANHLEAEPGFSQILLIPVS